MTPKEIFKIKEKLESGDAVFYLDSTNTLVQVDHISWLGNLLRDGPTAQLKGEGNRYRFVDMEFCPIERFSFLKNFK